MISVSALAGLLVLFPIAWLLNRRAPHLGLQIPEPAAAMASELAEAARSKT
jgi:hypothetical protein